MAYLPLSTANLPEPTFSPADDASPEDYFNTVLYTGNASTQSITGVGFQPDFVWIKSRDSTNTHALYDAVRTATKCLVSADTTAETTRSGLTSFDADGFSLGSLGRENASGQTTVAWNWKANGSGVSNTDGSIPSMVSANTTSGFSIIEYTGNSTAGATVGHGLGVKPDMMIFKRTSTTGRWITYHSALGATKYLTLETTEDESTLTGFLNNTEPTSTLITLGSDQQANSSGATIICYAFHSVEGFSKFGSYEGGSSPFVYTGFRPALIWIKSVDSTSDWYCFDDKREGYNVDNDFLELNDLEDEDPADLIDILSNGFKIRGSSGTDPNVSETYIYACWASNPFKYSLAR